jgi:hypothetical protein
MRRKVIVDNNKSTKTGKLISNYLWYISAKWRKFYLVAKYIFRKVII